MRRKYYVSNDAIGPPTRPHLRLTRVGLGAKLALIGNPVGFIVSPLECWPFRHDTGNEDAASVFARENFATIPDTAQSSVQGTETRTRSHWRQGDPNAIYSPLVVTSGAPNAMDGGGDPAPSGGSLWRRVMRGKT